MLEFNDIVLVDKPLHFPLGGNMYLDRVGRLNKNITKAGLDAFVIIPSPTMLYLAGLSFHLMERPTVAIFRPEDPQILILPKLELSKAKSSQVDFTYFFYEEDIQSRTDAFEQAANVFATEQLKVGIEPLRMRAFEIEILRNAMPGAEFKSAAEVVADLRIFKDQDEIKSMKKAVTIAESAMTATFPLLQIGMTERDIAAELVIQLLRSGSESEVPFSPIVASGPNSALPHAVPTDRTLQPGDLLIIDWGARVDGYVSDLTRTYAVGEIDEEFERIYSVVKDANGAGIEAVRPGVPCGDVDQAARSVITSAGFGEYFIHRTGHGIGLEAHEGPYIFDGNQQTLSPGMTFTVEPGIYLTNKGGVRIEDNVVVTQEGGRSLSTFSRELKVIS